MASRIASALTRVPAAVRNTFSNVQFAGKMRSFSTTMDKQCDLLMEAMPYAITAGAVAGSAVGTADAIRGQGMIWEGSPTDIPDACLKVTVNVATYGLVGGWGGTIGCIIRYYPLTVCLPVGAAMLAIDYVKDSIKPLEEPQKNK